MSSPPSARKNNEIKMPGRILRALGFSGALDEATGLPRKYARFDDDSTGLLLGPLPPPNALEVPRGHVGSKLFTERVEAREYVLKNSPVLFHTESWIETLLAPREWMPPSIIIFVMILVSARARAPGPRIPRTDAYLALPPRLA
jgi:hypothetical protein